MYMNRRGIQEETRRRNDAMFDALPFGIAGISLMTLTPFISFGIFVFDFPLFDMRWPTAEMWVLLLLINGAGVGLGEKLHRRWRRAFRAVRVHTRQMKEETEKRGAGWAVS